MMGRVYLRLAEAVERSDEATVRRYIATGKPIRLFERPYIPRPPSQDLTWLTQASIDFDRSTIAAPQIRVRNGPVEVLSTQIDIPEDSFQTFLLPAAQGKRPRSHQRYAGDVKLVSEAVSGLKEGKWPNVYKAAAELAGHAEGQSPEANVDRLYRKIRKALGPF